MFTAARPPALALAWLLRPITGYRATQIANAAPSPWPCRPQPSLGRDDAHAAMVNRDVRDDLKVSVDDCDVRDVSPVSITGRDDGDVSDASVDGRDVCD